MEKMKKNKEKLWKCDEWIFTERENFFMLYTTAALCA